MLCENYSQLAAQVGARDRVTLKSLVCAPERSVWDQQLPERDVTATVRGTLRGTLLALRVDAQVAQRKAEAAQATQTAARSERAQRNAGGESCRGDD